MVCQKYQLNEILPENVEYRVNKISDHDIGQLFPEERNLIKTSCEKRQKEFIAGRLTARKALNRLGFESLPILLGKLREPLWPEGAVGSISHCDKYCFVAVAKRKHFMSIGVDIEPAEPLPNDIKDLVLTEHEKKWTESMHQRGCLLPWSKVLFSAKESAYKCIYPVVRKFIDFQETEIEFLQSGNLFKLKMPTKKKNVLFFKYFSKITGLFSINEKYIITASLL